MDSYFSQTELTAPSEIPTAARANLRHSVRTERERNGQIDEMKLRGHFARSLAILAYLRSRRSSISAAAFGLPLWRSFSTSPRRLLEEDQQRARR